MLSVVSDELGGFSGDLFEDVVDEGVHDGHGSLGDSGLWVNLLQDSVDVHGEGFGSCSSSLWCSSSSSLGWGVSSGFSGHFDLFNSFKISISPPAYKQINLRAVNYHII